MHAPGLPAFPTAGWAARVPRAAAGLSSRCASPTRRLPSQENGFHTHTHARSIRSCTQTSRGSTQCWRRGLHASSVRAAAVEAGAPAPPSDGDGNGNGADKPVSGAVQEQQSAIDSHLTHGGRSKLTAGNSLRSRQARRRNASVLPPVDLPARFLEDNVHMCDTQKQPVMPLLIAQHVEKKAKQSRKERKLSAEDRASWTSFIESRIRVITERLLPKYEDEHLKKIKDSSKLILALQGLARLQAVLIDDTTHYIAAISKPTKSKDTKKKTSFWQWDEVEGSLRKTFAFDSKGDLEHAIGRQLQVALHFDTPLLQTVSDFDPLAFAHLKRHLQTELATKAPTSFEPKTSRRPINVLLTTGYSGSVFSKSIIRNMAHLTPANVVELDAYDLASIIGKYLGQDPAYSRGSLSMLGYRAAELNGRLPVPESKASKSSRNDDDDDDDDDFVESRYITVRGPGNQNDDMPKLSAGDFDVFSKWDGLKIDKILDEIIRSTDSKLFSGEIRRQKTIIHLHDYVELSMTLEGSFLISRLRALVDAAWQRGRPVVLMGTSSCNNPSEDYQNMVREISAQDTVVTRHFNEMFQPDRADIAKADSFLENVTNVKRMVEVMDPEQGHTAFSATEDLVNTALQLGKNSGLYRMYTGIHRFLDGILPAPEIYRIAQVYRSKHMRNTTGSNDPQREINALVEGNSLLPEVPHFNFMQHTVREMDPAEVENILYGSVRLPAKDEPEPEKKKEQDTPTPELKGLNEYEKRIAGGIIAKDKLHVTFGDVHAPAETTSALRLLTSLTLLRPDAFAYGILKRDKINGCLLYGPPGTGKTMLAKAVAKDSGANMLELSGASINDKYVGESEKLIRAVFTLAKRLSPCVIFIDEADALLANRGMGLNRTVHRELINQFLRQWDGIVETNAFIMVATNRPFDLDDAVLRRLPRKLLMDLPTPTDRTAILKLLLREEKLDPEISLETLATRTPFYSGSDLKNLCVAAAMSAVEEENILYSDYLASGGKKEDWRWPEQRTLLQKHFDKGLAQIPASISEDMPSLKAIRKFDEEYGDGKKGKKRKGKGMGFGIVPEEEVPVKEVQVRV
ncbi:AAA-domain-containing protein [Sarocladium strictum]